MSLMFLARGERNNFYQRRDGKRQFGDFWVTKGNLDIECPSGHSMSKFHIITTKFEHHAVLNSCKQLEKKDFEVTYLDVGKDSIVDPKDVAKGLKTGNDFSFHNVCQ